MLLHGFLDSSAGWRAVGRQLPGRTWALDLPGFGRSDCPSRPEIGAYAARIGAAVERLCDEPVVLVGHSFGGAVAVELLRREPDRIAGAVLVAPAGFGGLPLAAFGRYRLSNELAAAVLPLGLANPLVCGATYMGLIARRPPSPRLLARAFLSAPRARAGVRAALGTLAELAQPRGRFRGPFDYPGELRVVWGARDRLVPAHHAEVLRAAFAQARVEIWPRVGHHPQAEAPERLVRTIQRSCERAGRARRSLRPSAGPVEQQAA
ncbi:MAG TPA: alpha/beta fold hydrolase [Solirubrobacteraceae bacterium]|nr:alpha/beta fold hydrolase [Solirubrobacteraceae bacterium]